jgi:hypothetical protein
MGCTRLVDIPEVPDLWVVTYDKDRWGIKQRSY